MKADLRKINFNQSSTWNIWKQLGIDIDKLSKNNKLDVTTYFMPETEQRKVIDYLIKNYRKMKFYKPLNKHYITLQIGAEYLAYFPRGMYKDKIEDE